MPNLHTWFPISPTAPTIEHTHHTLRHSRIIISNIEHATGLALHNTRCSILTTAHLGCKLHAVLIVIYKMQPPWWNPDTLPSHLFNQYCMLRHQLSYPLHRITSKLNSCPNQLVPDMLPPFMQCHLLLARQGPCKLASSSHYRLHQEALQVNACYQKLLGSQTTRLLMAAVTTGALALGSHAITTTKQM